jgi:hypothetical protein
MVLLLGLLGIEAHVRNLANSDGMDGYKPADIDS